MATSLDTVTTSTSRTSVTSEYNAGEEFLSSADDSSNKARTPKWAIRYGLVNNAERERKARKSQWAKRYDERLPESTFVGQELAEGEEGPNYVPTVPGQQKRRPSEGLWDREDEIYYNEGESTHKPSSMC